MGIQEIMALEPRVADLMTAAKLEARQGANPDVLYVRYKRLLNGLVGFCAADQRLRGEAEYVAACEALYDTVGL